MKFLLTNSAVDVRLRDESMTAEGLSLKKEEGVKKSSFLRIMTIIKIMMSFSCSLHQWTQTCWLSTCKLMLSNIQNCDRSEKNLKKSEKAFQQKPKDSVHRGQTSAIQLCFFLLTCFMMKALNTSSLFLEASSRLCLHVHAPKRKTRKTKPVVFLSDYWCFWIF